MTYSTTGAKAKFYMKPKAAPSAKASPATPHSSAERLMEVVASSVASDPYEVEGNQWCKLGRNKLAQQLGVNERTITRIVRDQPFVATTRMVDDERTLLVRIGEPSVADQFRETGIILRTIWRLHLEANIGPKKAALSAEIEALKDTLKTAKGEERDAAKAKLAKAEKSLKRLHISKETRKEFGLLVGLASAWPKDLAVELLKLVLSDWGGFMVAVKVAVCENPPQTGKAYVRELDELYLTFPNLSVVRLFAYVALEMLEMQYQANGKQVPPASLLAANPSSWAPKTP